MTGRNIKDMVSGDKKVRFIHYRAKNLWYRTEDGFEFPVPIDDIGEATFLAEDRAMLFMRYIRKALNEKEDAVAEAGYKSVVCRNCYAAWDVWCIRCGGTGCEPKTESDGE